MEIYSCESAAQFPTSAVDNLVNDYIGKDLVHLRSDNHDGYNGYDIGGYGAHVLDIANNSMLPLRNPNCVQPVEHVCFLYSWPN